MAREVINTYLDSDDEDVYTGEQKEIQREAQELRAVQSWINQEGWDAAPQGCAVSQKKTGQTIDLRIDWHEVRRNLTPATVIVSKVRMHVSHFLHYRGP